MFENLQERNINIKDIKISILQLTCYLSGTYCNRGWHSNRSRAVQSLTAEVAENVNEIRAYLLYDLYRVIVKNYERITKRLYGIVRLLKQLKQLTKNREH